MEKMNDLKSLLQHEVQDLISVEDQIIEAMPAMIEKAQNGGLKKALQQHLSVTEKQRERLNKVEKLVSEQNKQAGEDSKGFLSGLFDAISGEQKCKGMEGIITEGQKIMKADMNAEVMDAAIIACAQKIEHYEICGYGTARAYAMQLNMNEAVKLLQETLGEEYEADDRLTKLAVGDVNEKAKKSAASGGSGKKPTGNGAAKNNSNGLKKTAAAKKNDAPKKAANAESNKSASKKVSANAGNNRPTKAAAQASNQKSGQNKKAATKSSAVKKSNGKK